MADNNNKEIMTRSVAINGGWSQNGAAKEVIFMSIAQRDFQAKIDSCAAKDAAVAEAEARLRDLKDERNDEYRGLNQMAVKVRDGVEGNENYGDDSPLYGSMGFKRKSERASGLTRKKKPTE